MSREIAKAVVGSGLCASWTRSGLAVDAEGAVWTAMWGGGSIRRYAPDGALLAEVPVPVTYPTSVCFGGPDLGTLFVTTSRHHLAEGADEPLAGAVLAVEPGVHGVAVRRFGT